MTKHHSAKEELRPKRAATASRTVHIQHHFGPRPADVSSLFWIVVALLSSISLSGITVSAQQTTPYVITTDACAIRTRTQFVILGGRQINSTAKTGPAISQLISLNLTTPWITTDPVWNRLGTGPANGSAPDAALSTGGPAFVDSTMALSSDGLYLNTFGANTVSKALSYRYTFETGIWAPSAVTATNISKTGVQAVQDPATGYVYVAGGYAAKDNTVFVYNFATDSQILSLLIPTTLGPGETVPYLTDRLGYAAVYTALRKSFLYFGGVSTELNPSPTILTEFLLSNQTWNTPDVKGGGPTHRSSLCMAANDNGTKVAVFGGLLDSGVYANDLWVLDVATMTWTQGPTASEGRVGSVCTFVNNTLINWGGYNGLYPNKTEIVIFDFLTNAFVTNYQPSNVELPPPPVNNNTGPSTGDKQDSPLNAGAIIGGSAGGAVVLVAIVGVGFYFSRRNRKRAAAPPKKKKRDFSMVDHTLHNQDDFKDHDGFVSYEKNSPQALSAGSPSSVTGSATLYSTSPPPRLDTAILGFVPNYRDEISQEQHFAMPNKFYAHEGRKVMSQPILTSTSRGDHGEWYQMDNDRLYIDPAKAFKAGAAAAAATSTMSPRERELQMQLLETQIREQQNMILLQQRDRDVMLLKESQMATSKGSPESSKSRMVSSHSGTPPTIYQQMTSQQLQQHQFQQQQQQQQQQQLLQQQQQQLLIQQQQRQLEKLQQQQQQEKLQQQQQQEKLQQQQQQKLIQQQQQQEEKLKQQKQLELYQQQQQQQQQQLLQQQQRQQQQQQQQQQLLKEQQQRSQPAPRYHSQPLFTAPLSPSTISALQQQQLQEDQRQQLIEHMQLQQQQIQLQMRQLELQELREQQKGLASPPKPNYNTRPLSGSSNGQPY